MTPATVARLDTRCACRQRRPKTTRRPYPRERTRGGRYRSPILPLLPQSAQQAVPSQSGRPVRAPHKMDRLRGAWRTHVSVNPSSNPGFAQTRARNSSRIPVALSRSACPLASRMRYSSAHPTCRIASFYHDVALTHGFSERPSRAARTRTTTASRRGLRSLSTPEQVGQSLILA